MPDIDDDTKVDASSVHPTDTQQPPVPEKDGDNDDTAADGLSARQKEILRMVAQHFERKEIANALKISPHTVKAHIDAARKRIGVSTDKQAARWLAERDKAKGLKPGGTSMRQSPTEAMADQDSVASSLGHEQALRSERQLHADQLVRTGDGAAGAFSPGEAIPDRGQHSDRPGALPHRRPGEGHHSSGGNDSLADGWGGALSRRLMSLNVTQGIGSIIVLAILLALAFVVLIAGGATTMQAIQNLTGQTG
ncbi:response regulator transcription factor [Asticcacaulis sp. AC402]|uniref:response regulator transcription factor n=1 Tax=Asticcacaulis sp. AC402 TaxID=1282361 RepID=UPI0003C3C511|nr:helix-turn-helix transcriptional regulator [Asticcacaulis sp. AC402]ESQ74255.1 hypothetical protein ABAC402_14915 [Asticcacaulis sp. AC402]